MLISGSPVTDDISDVVSFVMKLLLKTYEV